MAKKKQETVIKPRYSVYCHECKTSFDVDALFYVCKCGGEALTLNDHSKATSGYYVKSEKR